MYLITDDATMELFLNGTELSLNAVNSAKVIQGEFSIVIVLTTFSSSHTTE